jgi:hypothetical protein
MRPWEHIEAAERVGTRWSEETNTEALLLELCRQHPDEGPAKRPPNPPDPRRRCEWDACACHKARRARQPLRAQTTTPVGLAPAGVVVIVWAEAAESERHAACAELDAMNGMSPRRMPMSSSSRSESCESSLTASR